MFSEANDLTNILNDESFYPIPFGATHRQNYRDKSGLLQTADTSMDIIAVDSEDKIISFDKLYWPQLQSNQTEPTKSHN